MTPEFYLRRFTNTKSSSFDLSNEAVASRSHQVSRRSGREDEGQESAVTQPRRLGVLLGARETKEQEMKTWRLIDIVLVHEVLGIIQLQMLFETPEGKTFSYQMPFKLNEPLENQLCRLRELWVGIEDCAAKYSKIP
jgi:hypothetical protein